ncbi:Class II aaRS and biotin synthetases superfamily protein [Abeliophyllum distichum]|uniref:Class II aaRS and biotin synthetases superfamily protein n=1 Tax=Abeliophyllum distichum TaxID=126358 RepID=A0ABD1T1V5_9LAMI
MIMVHGDNKGLVLPPKVASIQAIVIPVPYKDANTQGIFDACEATVKILSESGIRAEADFRDNYSPGWKYSHWEMKAACCRRDNSAKIDIPIANLVEQVKDLLNIIQTSLFEVAKEKRDACIQVVDTVGKPGYRHHKN